MRGENLRWCPNFIPVKEFWGGDECNRSLPLLLRMICNFHPMCKLLSRCNLIFYEVGRFLMSNQRVFLLHPIITFHTSCTIQGIMQRKCILLNKEGVNYHFSNLGRITMYFIGSWVDSSIGSLCSLLLRDRERLQQNSFPFSTDRIWYSHYSLDRILWGVSGGRRIGLRQDQHVLILPTAPN